VVVIVVDAAASRYILMSGGDDGALVAHYIDLSIKSVMAHGRQSLAHAAQITGPISAVLL